MKILLTLRKKPFFAIITIGYLLLYIISMFICTYLMKIRISDDYTKHLGTIQSNIINNIYSENGIFNAKTASESDSSSYNKFFIEYLNMLLSSNIQGIDENQQFSAALYNADGTKIAQTTGHVSCAYYPNIDTENSNDTNYNLSIPLYFSLSDYFTYEEICIINDYNYKNSQTNSYPFVLFIDSETGELLRLQIHKDYYSETDENGYSYLTGRTLEWTWTNPKFYSSDSIISNEKTIGSTDFYLPYCNSEDISMYDKWMNDIYLQEFPDYYDKKTFSELDADTKISIIMQLKTDGIDITPTLGEDQIYTLAIRQTTHPWKSAFSYMINTYMAVFAVMILSAALTLYLINVFFEKQSQLELARRDFTNAAAHELKTPLGIIRGFSENIKEKTNPQKDDYYLEQVVKQTENMDSLVKEMIDISKMDSTEFELHKESISLTELTKQELKKFDALIFSKNLIIIYDIEEEFEFEGDKHYFEKLIWNLLSNAIEYNIPNGFITIASNFNSFSITNTGKNIDNEDLPHIFDMFYTGNKSRTSTKKHLGLGLYLAKRISQMHHMKLEIKNVEDGVKVTIS